MPAALAIRREQLLCPESQPPNRDTPASPVRQSDRREARLPSRADRLQDREAASKISSLCSLVILSVVAEIVRVEFLRLIEVVEATHLILIFLHRLDFDALSPHFSPATNAGVGRVPMA